MSAVGTVILFPQRHKDDDRRGNDKKNILESETSSEWHKRPWKPQPYEDEEYESCYSDNIHNIFASMIFRGKDANAKLLKFSQYTKQLW